MIGRVTEWETSMRDEGRYIRLYASAQYGRGSVPNDAEIERLGKRVHAKFPKAELVSLTRRVVPRIGGGNNFTRVWWDLCWIVFED